MMRLERPAGRPGFATTRAGAAPLSWRRALALWLALLGLTVQTLAPVAHARALEHFAAGASGGYAVVCSADGLKLIDLEALAAADAGDGKAVGFHIPFDVHAKAGKHACCVTAGVPAISPALPGLLPPAYTTSATASPRTARAQRADRSPPDRPGNPRDPPLSGQTASP